MIGLTISIRKGYYYSERVPGIGLRGLRWEVPWDYLGGKWAKIFHRPEGSCRYYGKWKHYFCPARWCPSWRDKPMATVVSTWQACYLVGMAKVVIFTLEAGKRHTVLPNIDRPLEGMVPRQVRVHATHRLARWNGLQKSDGGNKPARCWKCEPSAVVTWLHRGNETDLSSAQACFLTVVYKRTHFCMPPLSHKECNLARTTWPTFFWGGKPDLCKYECSQLLNEYTVVEYVHHSP